MKILYFTSTGNCLYVAKKLNAELLSIPQMQKNKIYEITDDVVGIITPIYGFDIPRPAREYLAKVKINADYVFSIMTYGQYSMAAVSLMKDLLRSRGVTLHYSNEIKMVDNYLPNFEIEKQLAIKNDNEIDKAIDAIVRDIQIRRQYILPKNIAMLLTSKLFSSVYASDKGKKMMNDAAKKFTITDECTGCGICRKVCPMNNIAGENKPTYLDKCEFCLACIHLCPKNAIHLKNQKSVKRFKNKNVTLSEIIDANCQL